MGSCLATARGAARSGIAQESAEELLMTSASSLWRRAGILGRRRERVLARASGCLDLTAVRPLRGYGHDVTLEESRQAGTIASALAALPASGTPAARLVLARLHPPLAQVGVRVRAVFDKYRRRKQIEGLAEHVRQVACVGRGHRGGLVAVDDDAGRIAPALVRVAQLDAPPANQGRLVHGEGVLERARELTRGHGTHRR